MRKKLISVLIGVGIVAAGLASVFVAQALNPPPERQQPQPLAMLVDTIPVEVRSLTFDISSQGLVEPRTETVLVSEVAGKVDRISPNLIAGGFFEQGEVLLQIDRSDYETALKSTEANLASRRAQLSQEQARSEQARRDWLKLNTDRGEPNELVLRIPQLEEAQANVRAAEADVAKAQRDLERTRIRAPYAGLVKEKQVDIGQYVSPGTTLGMIAAIDTAEIRLPISDDDLAFVNIPDLSALQAGEGPAVDLWATVNGREQRWPARIMRTEGVVDQRTRQLYAVAQIIDPYGVLGQREGTPLRFGTFVRAEIEGVQVDQVAALPRHTLRPDNTILLMNQASELEIRPVQVGRSTPETVFIAEGLGAGEAVITTAIEAPVPGTRVRDRNVEDSDQQIADEADTETLPEDSNTEIAADTGDDSQAVTQIATGGEA